MMLPKAGVTFGSKDSPSNGAKPTVSQDLPIQAIGGLKQPLERGTVSGVLSECPESEVAPTVDP